MAKNEIIYRGNTYQRIKNGSCFLATSLSFSQLEASTINVTIESDDETLADFETYEPLVYKHRGRTIGEFYTQSVTRISENLYQFNASNVIGLLIAKEHNGGLYNGITAEELIHDICGGVPVVVKGLLKSKKVFGWLPIASARDNLSQVLFSICAVVRVDYNGLMHIDPLWDGISNYQDRICMGAKAPYDKKVTSVVVTEHQWIKSEDEEELFQGIAKDGEKIPFREPMWGLIASGVTIKEYGDNYAILSAGEGTLKGKTYTHLTRQITRKVSDAKQPNVKYVNENATLVTLTNSAAIADRMADFYRTTERIEAPAYWHNEQPGDRLYALHPYGSRGVVDAVVQSLDINMSNVLKAHSKMLVGFVPPTPESGSGELNAVEVISSNTVWDVKPGITAIRVVLIQAGGGGWSGLPGEKAAESEEHKGSQVVSGKTRRYVAATPTEGGVGGGPGEGGEAGRVYVIDLNVTEGEQFAITVGAPGAGGAPGESSNQGSAGGHTTFGVHTSASGDVLSGGYFDPINQVTYAKPGAKGFSGGKGSGATWDNVGQILTPVYGDPITINGQTYSPGQSKDDTEKRSKFGSTTTGRGEFTALAMGGYGGGAAYGRDGYPGFAADVDGDGHGYVIADAGRSGATGANGGNGADALPPPDGSVYGCGGDGGNGGGGAGSRGHCRAGNNYSASQGPGVISVRKTNESVPGQGSRGGVGGSGCVLVYYHKSTGGEYGGVIGRDGMLYLDKYGRITVR